MNTISTADSTDGQNATSNSHGNNRSRNRNRNGNKQGSGDPVHNDKKFTRLDQDELKGLIINSSSSQEYDKLFEELKVLAGKKNSSMKSTLLSFKKLTEMSFIPAMPEPLQYTTVVGGVTTEHQQKESVKHGLAQENKAGNKEI